MPLNPAAALAAALLAVSATTTISPARAGDIQGDAYDCGELWVMRNTIYKEAGYCFRSSKAISQFGNAGCRYDAIADVPLSDTQRLIVRDIRRSEKRQRCNG